jgi:hypothetical protein
MRIQLIYFGILIKIDIYIYTTMQQDASLRDQAQVFGYVLHCKERGECTGDNGVPTRTASKNDAEDNLDFREAQTASRR